MSDTKLSTKALDGCIQVVEVNQHELEGGEQLAIDARAELTALAAHYQPQPPEGHNQPCYYCGEPCNALVGNPGKWPLAFPHRDEPGVVKWQHVGCVVARLTENQPVGIAEAVKAAEEAMVLECASSIFRFVRDNFAGNATAYSLPERIRGLRNGGALDRYVASKVREAKIAAYERCAEDIEKRLNVRYEFLDVRAQAHAETFHLWAEAERKEAGQ